MDTLLVTVVAAVFLGILAQVIAYRFKLPAILPLLLLGMATGPFGLSVLDPSSLGHGLEVVLHLGVAVILFEGGLSLDLRQLQQVSRSLGALLSVGTAITGIGAAALAHYVTGISWSTAALFGAIVTVTGPTVISPLLRHMVAPKKVRTLLLSEGLMIDPIGAVLAYLVLQWIEHSEVGYRAMAMDFFELSLIGSVSGIVAGVMAIQALRRRFLPEELRNLVILALLFGSFLFAEYYAKTSGILSSVVMGLVVSYAEMPDLSPLKAFKGQLTVLFISVLFILLSGQLDLNAMRSQGWEGMLVVAGLIFLVRPLSVIVSMAPGSLDWRETTLLALTAPRGIVAAAVASLSAIQLRNSGQGADATALEGLVYLVIIVTCTWATLMAGWLPRLLGYYGDPSRRRVLLVGANSVSLALAHLFRARDWTVVMVDSVARKLTPYQEQGLIAISGDARDASTYERAGIERDTEVLVVTANDALNLLVAELVRDEFGVEHPVVALQHQSGEFGSTRRAWMDLLTGRELGLMRWENLFKKGEASIRTFAPIGDEKGRQRFTNLAREQPSELVLLFGWREGGPVHEIALDELDSMDYISVLVTDKVLPELETITLRHKISTPEELEALANGIAESDGDAEDVEAQDAEANEEGASEEGADEGETDTEEAGEGESGEAPEGKTT